MENIREKREYLDQMSGIKVTVFIQDNRYLVELYIPEGTFRYVRSISYSNKAYQLNLVSVDGADGPVTIKLNKGYKKGRFGLVKNKQAVSNIEKPEFTGKLILNPKFYIPDEMRATSKNLKKAEKVRKEAIICGSEDKPSPSRMTIYTVSNVAHPYRGGRMSSK